VTVASHILLAQQGIRPLRQAATNYFIGGSRLKEHLAVIKAVTSGSADLAKQTMREYLTSVITAHRQLSDIGLLAGQVASPLLPEN